MDEHIMLSDFEPRCENCGQPESKGEHLLASINDNGTLELTCRVAVVVNTDQWSSLAGTHYDPAPRNKVERRIRKSCGGDWLK